MKTLIVGCGYVGTHLAEALKAKGHEVWAVRRGALSLKELEDAGIRTLQADITRAETLGSLPSFDLVVFTQAPKNDSDTYRNVYYLGTKNILNKLKAKPPKKVIFISSTSVYSVTNGEWVDETSPTLKGTYESREAEANAKCLVDAENFVLTCGVPASILRLGGIYGPGRHRLKAIREGKIKPSYTNNYTNRIHLHDIIEAILLLIEKGAPGEIYLGVDDCPSTQKEFYTWLCRKLGLRAEGAGEAAASAPHVSNKRCSNRKIKSLGFRPKYPSFKEGYEALLNECR